MTKSVDLIVLVNGFPRLSETFVLAELLHLERLGARLQVVALSNPDEVVRQEALGRLRAPVFYLPDKALIPRRRIARAHAVLAHARGPSYPAALLDLRGSPDWTPGTLKRAALLAHWTVRLGSPPLYVHFAHKPGTIGRFAAKLAGVPYGLSCHAKDIWVTPPEELRRKVRDAEIVLTCTEDGRAELARHASGATPVKLAYHGVDLGAAVARAPAASPPRVLTVGRLVEKKGHDVLIRAAARLRERGVRFTLRIAGEGPEWSRLQRLVHELDIDREVTFLGPLSPGELRREWAQASVFALGCRCLPNGDRDGLPNVLLEAMVNGLPVVATDQPGINEAVQHEYSGLLVVPEDAGAFATALERVLNEPRLGEVLARNAQRAVCERFDRERLLPAVAGALADAGLLAQRVRESRLPESALELEAA